MQNNKVWRSYHCSSQSECQGGVQGQCPVFSWMRSWPEDRVGPLAPGSDQSPWCSAWADSSNAAASFYPMAVLAPGLVCHSDPCSSLHLLKKQPQRKAAEARAEATAADTHLWSERTGGWISFAHKCHTNRTSYLLSLAPFELLMLGNQSHLIQEHQRSQGWRTRKNFGTNLTLPKERQSKPSDTKFILWMTTSSRQPIFKIHGTQRHSKEWGVAH